MQIFSGLDYLVCVDSVFILTYSEGANVATETLSMAVLYPEA